MPAKPSDEPLERAFAYHQSGDLAKAEALYRQVLAADPDELNGLQLLGALTLASGRAAEAIGMFERAIAVLSRRGGETALHAALYNNLGSALRAQGRGAESVEVFRRGLALDPGLAELHANLGHQWLAQGDGAAAIASYQAAVRLDPADAGYRRHLAAAYAHAGHAKEAVELLQSALAIEPGSVPLRLDLARALVLAARHDAAAEALAELAREKPDDGAIHLELANALHAADRPQDALIALERVATLLPDDPAPWLLRGRIHEAAGKLDDAANDFRAALRRTPASGEARLRLAIVLADAGKPAEAVDVCRELLKAEPLNAAAHCVLGTALCRVGEGTAAVEALVQCLRLKPDYVAGHYHLGIALGRIGQPRMAAACLDAAVMLKPDYVAAYVELGNVLQAIGEHERARACFRRVQELRPLMLSPAVPPQAEFSVLAIVAPGSANTPHEYLIGRSNYQTGFYALLPGVEPDLALLRRHGDVVINLISDVDQGRDVLEAAVALADKLQKPMINHPLGILSTGREEIAGRLVGIHRCHVPKTRRIDCHELAAGEGIFPFPMLLRVAGTHGGDAFEKIESEGEIGEFLSQHPATDYYVSEYVDYRASDGFFRKYRMMLVDGDVLPYHLAIGSQWKIHHFRTDMGAHPWMQQEEEAFLADPRLVFTEAHFSALRRIGERIGLEFFGVDCSFTRAGDLLVFEVNASMLIHDDNAQFPYKGPAVARIKTAFDLMLARKAALARTRQILDRPVDLAVTATA